MLLGRAELLLYWSMQIKKNKTKKKMTWGRQENNSTFTRQSSHLQQFQMSLIVSQRLSSAHADWRRVVIFQLSWKETTNLLHSFTLRCCPLKHETQLSACEHHKMQQVELDTHTHAHTQKPLLLWKQGPQKGQRVLEDAKKNTHRGSDLQENSNVRNGEKMLALTPSAGYDVWFICKVRTAALWHFFLSDY